MSSWLQHIDSTTVNEGNLSRRSSAVAAVKFISRIVQGNKKPNHIPNIRSQGLSPQARWVESPGKQPLEQEQRAFETLKYVLRILGYRLLDAETVNVTALAKALDASVVEVKAGAKAFPPESQKLFDSLAGQLDNVALVNGAFVSFYFIGFLVSELFGSLPNYKQNDPSLGPTLLRKLIIAAVGEDAFKENLTANLAALKVLAMTTERLSFTSVSSSIFPGFPCLQSSRYSNESWRDRHQNKRVYKRLLEHFELWGFPQPYPNKGVGQIKDWQFLSGDINSRTYVVGKGVDQHIGMNFGRVIYWLFCTAHRMPPGTAVIAYHDQHVALIRYLGDRFGYRVIHARDDLDLGGPHSQLDEDLRSVLQTWVIVMPPDLTPAYEVTSLQSAPITAVLQKTQVTERSIDKSAFSCPSSTSTDSAAVEVLLFPINHVTSARALYDFEADDGDNELAFSKGDLLEIVLQTKDLEQDGWCCAQLRGQNRIGLVPLDYLGDIHTDRRPSTPGEFSNQEAEQQDIRTPIVEEDRVAEGLHQDKNPGTTSLAERLLSSLALSRERLTMTLQNLLEKPPERGKRRVRWQCRCGHKSYDDFEELAAGGVDEWQALLRTYFNGSRDSRTNNIWTQLRNLVSTLLWSSAAGGYPSGDEEQGSMQQHPNQGISTTAALSTPNASSSDKIYVLLAFPYSRWGSKLFQPDLKHKSSDRAFFQLLHSSYANARPRVKKILSLKTIKDVKFVQLELHQSGVVDVNIHQPVPASDDLEYDFDPKPPKTNPPVGENFLLHMMFHPEEANGGKAPCSSKIPKRRKKLQTSTDSGIGLGWGLHFIEGWDYNLFWLVALLLVVIGVVVFFICWTVIRQDAVGAANIAGAIIGLVALLIGSVQAVISMDAV